MVEKRIKRLYRAYRTITREQAFACGFDGKWLDCSPNHEPMRHYDYRMARWLLQLFPWAVAVDFVQPYHNNKGTRYIPPEGYLIYVKSSATLGKTRIIG